MLERIKQAMRARLGDESDAAAQYQEAGFTLVELLIVVVVLGILAAVTVFGLSGTTGTSHQASCNSDVRSVEVAVEAYHANNNPKYPTLISQLIAPDPAAGNAAYLRTLPADQHYTISVDPGGTGIVFVDAHDGKGNVNYDDAINGKVVGDTNPCNNVS